MSKNDPQGGHTRVGAKQPTLYPLSTDSPEALCNLAPPESHVSSRPGVATWGQDAEIGKIGHLRWPTRVGFCGDLVKPSLDLQALTPSLVSCIRVCRVVTLAACCSPRGWPPDGGENSKEEKIWQRGTHRKLHNSG